jgi:hypothetical protein
MDKGASITAAGPFRRSAAVAFYRIWGMEAVYGGHGTRPPARRQTQTHKAEKRRFAGFPGYAGGKKMA